MLMKFMTELAIRDAISDFKNNKRKNPYKEGSVMWMAYESVFDKINTSEESVDFKKAK